MATWNENCKTASHLIVGVRRNAMRSRSVQEAINGERAGSLILEEILHLLLSRNFS
jgi:hypothetical protein